MNQNRETYNLKLEHKQPIPVLEQFLDIGNHSLLIKGETGTGKLTFCFELANNLKEKYEIYFITKSQDNQKIYRRASWIQSFISPTNIIDLYAKGDSTLSEDFEVYEVLNAVSTMSTMIHDPFVSENTKIPFIIIDAWDNLTKHIDDEKRSHIEKTLLSIVEKNNAFIIFISESMEMTSTESFVDGIIEVIHEQHELFIKRKMVFKKMNGIRAPYTKPFTLCDGRFRIFSKLKNKKIVHPNNFISIPDSDEKYSTGNSYFDNKLGGGFKKGSVIGLEINDSVDRFVFVPLFAPLILNFLSHNNSSIIVSPTDQDSNSLMRYIAPYLEEKQLLENLKIIGHSFSSKSDLMFEQNDSDFDHIKKEIIESYSHSKQKNKPTFLEMDCSLLELTYYNNMNSIQNSIVDFSRHVRSHNDLLVLSSRPGYKSSNVIKSLSDLYFRIFNYEGTTFLSAEKPQLFLCNIQADFEKGYPRMKLFDSS